MTHWRLNIDTGDGVLVVNVAELPASGTNLATDRGPLRIDQVIGTTNNGRVAWARGRYQGVARVAMPRVEDFIAR